MQFIFQFSTENFTFCNITQAYITVLCFFYIVPAQNKRIKACVSFHPSFLQPFAHIQICNLKIHLFI